MSTTFEHISPDQLPEEWRDSLRLKPGEKVKVTIERERQARKFDLEAFKRAVAEFHKLPILDHRSDEEIVGYDENGLPT